MAVAQFVLNPQRGGNSGITPKLGVVVHDSEGGENSAQLIQFCAAGGDRDNGHGGRYGGGYNAIATEAGSYYVVAEGHRSPYHAPPLNSVAWSICIPGRAAQTRDQWLDTPSRQYIRAVAAYIVDRWNDDGHHWPLTYVEADQLMGAGNPPTRPFGYTTHNNVSKAWHQTDHTDPGPGFPLDVLAGDIAALVGASTPATERVPVEDLRTIPVTEADDMSIKILRSLSDPPEFYAQFVAYTDADGHSIEVQWSGPGDDPKSAQRMTDLRAAGIVEEHVTLAGLRNNVLHPRHQPSDILDALHTWSAADFA